MDQQPQQKTTKVLFEEGFLAGLSVEVLFSITVSILFTAGSFIFNKNDTISDNIIGGSALILGTLVCVCFLFFYHRKKHNNISTLGAFTGWITLPVILSLFSLLM